MFLPRCSSGAGASSPNASLGRRLTGRPKSRACASRRMARAVRVLRTGESRSRQVRVEKTNVNEPLPKCRRRRGVIETGLPSLARGEVRGAPASSGTRHDARRGGPNTSDAPVSGRQEAPSEPAAPNALDGFVGSIRAGMVARRNVGRAPHCAQPRMRPALVAGPRRTGRKREPTCPRGGEKTAAIAGQLLEAPRVSLAVT